jgi:hypothetical protein
LRQGRTTSGSLSATLMPIDSLIRSKAISEVHVRRPRALKRTGHRNSNQAVTGSGLNEMVTTSMRRWRHTPIRFATSLAAAPIAQPSATNFSRCSAVYRLRITRCRSSQHHAPDDEFDAAVTKRRLDETHFAALSWLSLAEPSVASLVVDPRNAARHDAVRRTDTLAAAGFVQMKVLVPCSSPRRRRRCAGGAASCSGSQSRAATAWRGCRRSRRLG